MEKNKKIRILEHTWKLKKKDQYNFPRMHLSSKRSAINYFQIKGGMTLSLSSYDQPKWNLKTQSMYMQTSRDSGLTKLSNLERSSWGEILRNRCWIQRCIMYPLTLKVCKLAITFKHGCCGLRGKCLLLAMYLNTCFPGCNSIYEDRGTFRRWNLLEESEPIGFRDQLHFLSALCLLSHKGLRRRLDRAAYNCHYATTSDHDFLSVRDCVPSHCEPM